jgi:aspartyl-tRNA(Asn)/glutamyl-tRNA(Gln) amidotransferase subunit A
MSAGASAGAPDGGLCALTLTDLGVRIRRREVSPVEVTRAVLDRIAAHEDALRTFITLTPDAALAAARVAEGEIARGAYRGPLHGVPLSLKDLFATRGVLTTGGSPILRHWVPDEDAVAVARWREAGAVFLGKNTLHEFAFGGTSVNDHTGTPRNPWDPGRIAGGSSGGSAAAVAAGFAFGAMGSETGNSVRRPAAFCGVLGVKPTFGRISRRGVLPLSWSLDHVGVFARGAADAAALLAPLSGYDPADPGSRRPPAHEGDPATALAPASDLRGRRAAVPRALLTGIDPQVEEAFQEALDALRGAGVEVVEIDLPLASRWAAIASSVTMHAEAAATHEPWLRQRPADYGADVLARLLAGKALTAADYARAQAIREAIRHELLQALGGGDGAQPGDSSGRGADVLVAPATPAPAPPLQPGAYVPGDAPWDTTPGPFQLQRLSSLTGLPAASAPCGLNREGLPLGVQLTGRPWEEGLLLGFAGAMMGAVPPQRRAPPIAPLGTPRPQG